jgi:hypothetical protein
METTTQGSEKNITQDRKKTRLSLSLSKEENMERTRRGKGRNWNPKS